MASEEGDGKKQRAPHPATVQRKTTAQPGKRPSRPPHPATVQKKAAAPSGARKERPPHPATVQRTNGSTSAQRAAAPVGKNGGVTLAPGSSLYHATTYAGLNVLLRSGVRPTVNERTGAVFPTSTSLESGRGGLSGSGAVLELRTTRALQGGRDARPAASAEPARADTPPDFAVDRRGTRSLQCKLHPRALDALEPVAVHLRDARGAWARFTVAQYREMSAG